MTPAGFAHEVSKGRWVCARHLALLNRKLMAVAAGDPNKKREIGGHDSIAPMGPSRLRLSKPVIAAVEGFAVAGGMELALWADMRVVAEDDAPDGTDVYTYTLTTPPPPPPPEPMTVTSTWASVGTLALPRSRPSHGEVTSMVSSPVAWRPASPGAGG